MQKRRYLSLLLLPLLALLALEPREDGDAPRSIALTFDDSPNAELTGRLLDGLAARGAKATFFLIGEQIEGQEELVRRMAAEGHQLGNHTFTHRRLDTEDPEGPRELQKTDALLRKIAGERVYWVRPPWGFATEETLKAADAPLAYWSVDSEDWRSRNTETIVKKVEGSVRPGDIVLLHDAYATSVDAALRIVDDLTARGYSFVTLEELFREMNVTPESGTFYARPDELRATG